MREFLDLGVSLSPMDRFRLTITFRISLVDMNILIFGIKVGPSLLLLTRIHSADYFSAVVSLVLFVTFSRSLNTAPALPRLQKNQPVTAQRTAPPCATDD